MAPTRSLTRIIDSQRVRDVAALAHLALDEAQLERLTGDLERILAYVRTLEALDTRDVEPTTHAIDLPTHYRDDQARPGLPIDEVLRAAPERIGDGFGVPKVIDD